MNKIIAIVGMCGSGKSVASEILEELGYKKVYFGGVTLEKMKEEGIEITPDNEKKMREGLRSKYGMGAYAIILLPKIKELSKDNNVVLDGLYSWDELKILKDEFGDNLTLIAVIADKNIRYERLSKREIRPFTKDEAIKRDLTENLTQLQRQIVTDRYRKRRSEHVKKQICGHFFLKSNNRLKQKV